MAGGNGRPRKDLQCPVLLKAECGEGEGHKARLKSQLDSDNKGPYEAAKFRLHFEEGRGLRQLHLIGGHSDL